MPSNFSKTVKVYFFQFSIICALKKYINTFPVQSLKSFLGEKIKETIYVLVFPLKSNRGRGYSLIV